MTYETNIVVEPIPANPGYVAHITGHLADPESDPSGFGMTRLEAALDLARHLIEDADPCACLAIAAVLREAAKKQPTIDSGTWRDGMLHAASLIEGIA
jgi:hypothetical protein